jgi:hypothetical protein
MTEEILPMIFNYGFPSVIATYVIVRLERSMNKLNDSLTSIRILIEKNI